MISTFERPYKEEVGRFESLCAHRNPKQEERRGHVVRCDGGGGVDARGAVVEAGDAGGDGVALAPDVRTSHRIGERPPVYAHVNLDLGIAAAETAPGDALAELAS